MTEPKKNMDTTTRYLPTLEHYSAVIRTSVAQEHAGAVCEMQSAVPAKAQFEAYLRVTGVSPMCTDQRMSYVRFFMAVRGLPHAGCVVTYMDRRRKVRTGTFKVSSSPKWLRELRYVSVLDRETQTRKRIDIDGVIKVTMETWAF